jgi:hypothetical protein
MELADIYISPENGLCFDGEFGEVFKIIGLIELNFPIYTIVFNSYSIDHPSLN